MKINHPFVITLVCLISALIAYAVVVERSELITQQYRAYTSKLEKEVTQKDSLIALLRKDLEKLAPAKQRTGTGGGQGTIVFDGSVTSAQVLQSGVALVAPTIKPHKHESLKYRIYRISRDNEVKNDELSEILMEIVGEVEKLEKR